MQALRLMSYGPEGKAAAEYRKSDRAIARFDNQRLRRRFRGCRRVQKILKKALAIVFGSDRLSAPFPLKGMDSMFADR